MQKEEIIDSIIQYVNNNKVTYAVLINGAWGSGKTYLYDKYLKDEISKIENGKKERKTNVYISLYGISSIEQLAKELVSKLFIESKITGK